MLKKNIFHGVEVADLYKVVHQSIGTKAPVQTQFKWFEWVPAWDNHKDKLTYGLKKKTKNSNMVTNVKHSCYVLYK